MYKALIVDDERWVIDNIVSMIPWARLGYDIAGQAENGRDALALIQELRPDVVLTDIRMPVMDGLELIRRAAELPYTVRFIVISGHADFSYAQTALKFGASGYCLKPLEEGDIIELLVKVGRQLQSAEAGDDDLLEHLDGMDRNGGLAVSDAFTRMGCRWEPEHGAIAAVALGTGSLKAVDGACSLSQRIGTRKRLYIIEMLKDSPIDQVRAYKSHDIQSIGIGRPATAIGDVHASVSEAELAAYHSFITGRTGCYYFPALGYRGCGCELKELEQAMFIRDIAGIERAFTCIADAVFIGAYSIKSLLHLYNTILLCLSRMRMESFEDYYYSYEQFTGSFKAGNDAILSLRETVSAYFSGKSRQPDYPARNVTFQSIYKYVKENFRFDISIQKIAKEFYINPSYLCQLFKKEIGETFSEHLNELRLGFASELLRNSKMPINEIADMSGYSDYYYFNKLFKKHMGVSPVQFRNRPNI